MNSWKKIFVTLLLLTILIFIGTNYFILNQDESREGRPYRVEVNRIALQIEQKGIENLDLSQYEYVYRVEKCDDDFYNSDSDYVIRKIGNELYRFDYRSSYGIMHFKIIIIVNISLALMALAVFIYLFYIRSKILKPFSRLKDLPYELSKGNLTVPIKESKSHYFGNFLWGVDLLRENMEQQKKRELQFQKEKKTLLLSLSHDIKTPLSAIKLYSKALSKNLYSDSEKQKEIAENINYKADEIEKYVTQIINASREDFLSLEVENGEFYLYDLVEKIRDYYNEKLALVKTEFVIEEYENCLLFGDFDRSIEIMENIIENALKYGNGKYIKVIISHEDEGILISVQNSGCTLDISEISHIFESFWRGTNAENIQGSGLGLYICRQLMHKMNGEIFAEIQGEIISVTTVFSLA